MPRLFGIEGQYRQHTLRAELAWTQAIVADLGSGELDRTDEKINQWVTTIESRLVGCPGAVGDPSNELPLIKQ